MTSPTTTDAPERNAAVDAGGRSRLLAAARDFALSPLSWMLVGFSVLYATSLFPGVGGVVNHGDSAKFQFIGKVLGVSHPPGNPLYILVNAAWVRLPFPLRTCTKVTLLSTFFALWTLYFVYRTLERILSPWAAVAGAVALGTGSLFWTFATEAEVYTLNAFLLSAACYYASIFAETGEEAPFVKGAAFMSIGFANHLTSLLLLPGVFVLIGARIYKGSRLRPRDAAIVLGFLVVSAALYLYVPWRVRAGAAYTEFEGDLTWPAFKDYITAKEFQENFVHPGFVEAVRTRLPSLLVVLQHQWVWPLLLVIPTGIAAVYERAPLFAVFTAVSVACLLVFAFYYDIGDPEGFYMPVTVLLSFTIAGAMHVAEKSAPRSSWFALGTALTVGALAHVLAWSKRSGNNVVEGLDDEPDPVLWNLDDLFAHVPDGASIAVPCSHYGCVEVLDYYRYAEPVFRDKHLRFVRFNNIDPGYWDEGVPLVSYNLARTATVCTIRKDDAAAFKALHVALDEDYRPSMDTRGGTMMGVVLACSRPGAPAPDDSAASGEAE